MIYFKNLKIFLIFNFIIFRLFSFTVVKQAALTWAATASISIIAVLFILPSYAASNPSLPEWKKRLEAYEKISEEKIDIGKMSLELAREIFPLLNIKGYLKKVDKMADEVRALVGGKIDPDYRIRALNTYFYQKRNFQYDRSDPFTEKSENRYIIAPIDKGVGNCISLAILYLVVAQKLGYPIYGVAAPSHFFLRYVDPSLKKRNIEPTSRGRYFSDLSYAQDFNISKASIERGVYLKTLSNRELLGKLIRENAVAWTDKKNLERAYQYFKAALNLAPLDAQITNDLGLAYIMKADIALENAKDELEISNHMINKMNQNDFRRHAHFQFSKSASLRQTGVFLRKKAHKMGYTHISREDYQKMILEKIAKKGKPNPSYRVY